MSIKIISVVLLAASFLGSCVTVEIAADTSSVEIVEQGGNDMSEKFDFERITLNEHGSAAEAREYEAVKTKSGAILTLYIGRWNYDDKITKEECVEKRIEGGEELYDKLAALAGECDIENWDGFSETNPNVLDGYSFRFEAAADGKSIYASGSNAAPDHYYEFENGLRDILYEK